MHHALSATNLASFVRNGADKVALNVASELLDVEAELDHVAVGHDVVLAFHPHLAGGTRGSHRAGRHQVVVGDDLGLDEAALEVRMDHTGRLWRRTALADRP